MTLMPMKYSIHEQKQPLPPILASVLANIMNMCNDISIYIVTVIITPDATAYCGTARYIGNIIQSTFLNRIYYAP